MRILCYIGLHFRHGGTELDFGLLPDEETQDDTLTAGYELYLDGSIELSATEIR
jgi:hypothetical protein